MTQDNGARALEGRLAVVYGNGDGPPLRDHEYGAAAVLANGAAFLPDAAELERLRRIEAAARPYMAAWDGMRAEARKLGIWAESDEVIYDSPKARTLRAALAPEGSAGTETDECLIHLDHQSRWDVLMGVLGNPETAQAVIVALRAAEGSARDGG